MAAGVELTGDELGAEFDRSGRWGRDVMAEASAGLPDAGAGSPAELGRTPWYATVATVLVALVAAAASYGHVHALAAAAGEPTLIAWGVPLTVDGLAAAALWSGDRGRWWLRLALGVSIAANVAAADPRPIGWAVAAWPPLALYGTHRLWNHR
jgi:hypothetical protein